MEDFSLKDARMVFKDGKVTEFGCGNFPESEEQGKDLVKQVIMRGHSWLPLGEFAIGTNTTAYAMAQKYQIGLKLRWQCRKNRSPLSAGDACYSFAEDSLLCNPDGKEVIARDNEDIPFKKRGYVKGIFQLPYRYHSSLFQNWEILWP